MAEILMTPDGKKVVVSRDDQELYGAPHNPPDTGTAYTAGSDLLVHKARSGNKYYYLHHWSMWSGEGSFYSLLTEAEAKEFILDKITSNSRHVRGGVQSDVVEEQWGDDFLAEDA